MKEIYNKIKKAFEISDIKKLAEREKKQWYYSLCTSKPIIGQPLILGFNRSADSGNFKPQNIDNLPNVTNWSDMGLLSQIKEPLKKNFPMIDQESYNHANFCFFRSNNEKQITERDIKICEPIFEEFIAHLKPKIIFGYSDRLSNYLISNRRIKYLNEKKLSNGNTGVFLYQGFMRLNGWWTYINLLPHPNNRQYKEKKKTLWKFENHTYPYEYHFTDFLNFLESKGINPTLSENPIEEQGIRKALLNKDAFKFSNLHLHEYRTILPKNFDLYDISALTRFALQYTCHFEKIKPDYKYYIKKKQETELSEIITELFDKDSFEHSYLVAKMNLQRFYVANKFPDEFREYKKLNTKINKGYWKPIMS